MKGNQAPSFMIGNSSPSCMFEDSREGLLRFGYCHVSPFTGDCCSTAALWEPLTSLLLQLYLLTSLNFPLLTNVHARQKAFNKFHGKYKLQHTRRKPEIIDSSSELRQFISQGSSLWPFFFPLHSPGTSIQLSPFFCLLTLYQTQGDYQEKINYLTSK